MEDLLMRNCPLEGLLQQQLSVVESVGTGASFRSITSPDKFLAPAVKQTVRYLQQIAIQYCQVLYDDWRHYFIKFNTFRESIKTPLSIN